jgi:hypothetical protein
MNFIGDQLAVKDNIQALFTLLKCSFAARYADLTG